MPLSMTSCIRISDIKICLFCKSNKIIKNGFTKNRKQQFYCKNCHKRFIDYYSYKACNPNVNNQIVLLAKEGMGIRSTARLLTISTTTLLKRIVSIAQNIPQPAILKGKTYEIDEICSFINRKKNLVWITYALERTTKKVVSFFVGSRTCKALSKVVNPIILSEPRNIYTDKLKQHKIIIPEKLHKIKLYATNHIERNNLTIRTHLKRLSRKTICYSKSENILRALLKIYFWKETSPLPHDTSVAN